MLNIHLPDIWKEEGVVLQEQQIIYDRKLPTFMRWAKFRLVGNKHLYG